MAGGSGWLVPHLSTNVYSEFFHHTPFIFILEGLFFKVFGASFVSARIFVSLFTLSTLGLLIFWMKKEKSDKMAWLSGLILVLTYPLIKKSRFPNLDLPLMLFIFTSLYFYWKAFSENLNRDWILSGLFFGLALLTKGPMAVFVPLTLLVHLATTGSFKRLLKAGPWLGLLFGFLIFSIWPLSLYFNGKFALFEKYLDFTFFHTITEGRGEGGTSPFTYVVFLLKTCAPWFLLALYSSFKAIKDRKDTFHLLFAVAFFCILVPLSIPRFKYSHYLMPIYPVMAVLAAYPFMNLSEKILSKLKKGILGIAVTTALVLLIFPLTNKIRRDPEIYEIKSLMEKSGAKPSYWGIVDGAYPFWSLTNMVAWHDLGVTENLNLQDFEENAFKRENAVFILSIDSWNKLKNKNMLRPLFKFNKSRRVFLVSKDMFSGEFLFKD